MTARNVVRNAAAALTAFATLAAVVPAYAAQSDRMPNVIPGIVLGAMAPSDPAIAAPAWMNDHPFLDDADQQEPEAFPDPLERVNRATFAFNLKFDRFVYAPITRVYRLIVPTPARRAVRRALVNLDMPVTFVNDVL